MDIQEKVFIAAKNGDLQQLKICLDGKPKKELSSLVSARTNSTTPLIMACRNGHLDVALYLVEKCHADIEQVGSITLGEKTIVDASPLWHASLEGHLKIVEMLVKNNASVNIAQRNNTTPLLIACFNDRLKTVKFLIQHGADIEIADMDDNTCLMIACCKTLYKISKLLLKCGADTNKKNINGHTALHFCAQTGNLDILKILLKSGAKSCCDSHGTTPLLAAAVLGHSQFVEYFIHEVICTKEEQVNALELLGSCFLEKRIEEKAFEYWKRAMKLRYEDGEFPLEKPITRSPIASCIDASEVRTLYQLEELVNDPNEMSIQALLIVERIIGPDHPLAFYYIMLNGERYRENGNFHRCMKLWIYALDVQLKVENTYNRRVIVLLANLSLLFSSMMKEDSPLERCLPPVSFQDILKVFEVCLKIIEKVINVPITEKNDDFTSDVQHTLINALQLLGIMCRLRPHLNINEHTKLKISAYKLVHLDPKGRNGSTLLHLACSNDSSSCCNRFSIIQFPSPEVVDILLKVGACPHAVDADKNTPLHVAAMNKTFSPDVFKSLVNHGAHLCLRNNERKTPLQLVENIFLEDFSVQYINLKCLCAQAIRKYKIVYEGFVHEKLKEYVDSH